MMRSPSTSPRSSSLLSITRKITLPPKTYSNCKIQARFPTMFPMNMLKTNCKLIQEIATQARGTYFSPWIMISHSLFKTIHNTLPKMLWGPQGHSLIQVARLSLKTHKRLSNKNKISPHSERWLIIFWRSIPNNANHRHHWMSIYRRRVVPYLRRREKSHWLI